jgi:hypothetical protein
VNGKKLSPAGIVIMVGGVVMLIGSFLAFYKYSLGSLGISAADRAAARAVGVKLPEGNSISWSAWTHNGAPLFPLTILPVLLGLIMALQVGLTNLANVRLPERVLGFDWKQIHLLCGAQAALLMVLYLIVNKEGASFGVGFWLMLLASIALVVGAVMLSREPAAAPGGAMGTPPPAF